MIKINTRPPKILIIEDETDILLINKKHLEEEGYDVSIVQTLSDARVILNNNPPDLILLDVILPDGSGYDFCREIREQTNAPIIYTTAMNQNCDIVCGLTGGGDDYIIKPYDLSVLSARIIAHLRRVGLHGAGRLELHPLSINLYNSTAKMYGEKIFLTQKELQILAYLVSHIGMECRSSEIYEAVWGEPSCNSSRTVTVHISNLRMKLGLDRLEGPFEIRSINTGSYMFLKINY